MHRSENWRCGLVDQNLGRVASSMSKQMLVEVEHVQAHPTKKDKKEMSHFKKSVTDGKENADELAKAGAMLDEGFMVETRAKTVQLAVCGLFSLSGREIERLGRTQAEATRKMDLRG